MSANPQKIVNNENETETNIADDKMKIDLTPQSNTQNTDNKTVTVPANVPPNVPPLATAIKSEADKSKENNKINNAETELKPPKKRRKKRNQESGPLSSMKNELLIAARNKISFDTTKKVRKWIRQPVVFGTLQSNFNVTIWHSDEPKQLHIDKLLNKTTAGSTKSITASVPPAVPLTKTPITLTTTTATTTKS